MLIINDLRGFCEQNSLGNIIQFVGHVLSLNIN
jgi:hypothetical protein